MTERKGKWQIRRMLHPKYPAELYWLGWEEDGHFYWLARDIGKAQAEANMEMFNRLKFEPFPEMEEVTEEWVN